MPRSLAMPTTAWTSSVLVGMTIADAEWVSSPASQNGSRNSAMSASELSTAPGPSTAANASSAGDRVSSSMIGTLTARGCGAGSAQLGQPVQRAVAALGRRQAPALRRDRPALHAVGVVDDDVDLALLGRILGDLVDGGGTHPDPRLGDLARHLLLYADVVRRVVARRVAGDVDRRQLVEDVLAVGLGIAVLRVADEHPPGGVAVPVPAPAGEAALGHDHEVHDRPAAQEALL